MHADRANHSNNASRVMKPYQFSASFRATIRPAAGLLICAMGLCRVATLPGTYCSDKDCIGR